jgi:3-isopropylmalate dehydrogenase
MQLKIAVLPGDGVGPEVTEQAVRVLREVANIHGHTFLFEEQSAGGAAIKTSGHPYRHQLSMPVLAADAVLLGAVGTPEFDHLPFDKRPKPGCSNCGRRSAVLPI